MTSAIYISEITHHVAYGCVLPRHIFPNPKGHMRDIEDITLRVSGTELQALYVTRAEELDKAALELQKAFDEIPKQTANLRASKEAIREELLEVGYSNASLSAGCIGDRHDARPELLRRQATFLRFCGEHVDSNAKYEIPSRLLAPLFGVHDRY